MMTRQPGRLQDKERARRYARQMAIGSRIIYAPFARKIAQSLVTLREGATIVDLGTGPGLLAIQLHMLWPQARIIGVDPSSEMLRIARKNTEKAGMFSFEGRLAVAEQTSLPSNSADLVVSQYSFHEWQDRQKGLKEVLRILKPHGSLILNDYHQAWLSPWKRKLLSLFDHLNTFEFTFEQVGALLAATGFDGIEGQCQGLQWFVRATKP